MTLTSAALSAAPPTATFRDVQVQGLHTRGRKFYLYFRTKGGVERRPKLGEFPTMTVAQARDVARALLLRVAMGEDPMAERTAARAAPTLEVALAQFADEHLARRKSGANVKGILDRALGRALLGAKVADVTYGDIHRLHTGLRKTPVLANRVVANLSVLFGKCERWGYRAAGSNPCRGIERFPEKSRERYLRSDEAPRIAALLDAAADTHPAQVAFIYLLILTGARGGEIEAARWDWLDGRVLKLPDSKTGGKSIFLPQAAVDVLARLPRTSGTLTGIAKPYAFWYALREEAGCPDLRLHDLRHSFASAALDAGLSLAQIGELLGHASTQTTKRYAHLLEEGAHAAAARAATSIAGRLRGPTP